MSRSRRQLRVRNPNVLLLLPLLARPHCHAHILRTKPVDHSFILGRHPEFHHRLVGKTTIGSALAQELQWRFADGDDFHSAANIAKMHAGVPLTDEDRTPWLQSLRNAIAGWLASGENVVLACSALKASYREVLLVSSQVKLVYLRSSFELIAGRLALRQGHY